MTVVAVVARAGAGSGVRAAAAGRWGGPARPSPWPPIPEFGTIGTHTRAKTY